jgi:membrane associated rhomboid family serine protease
MAMRDVVSAMRKNGQPASIAIIVISAALFLITFVAPTAPITFYIAFLPSLFAEHPWSILTYPYAADARQAAFLIVLFECFWMYGIGGSVERDLGTKRFLIFWAAMTVLPGFLMWGAMVALKVYAPLVFLYLPLSGITIAWCARNPNEKILFMMVIPILGKWIGWITVGIVLFDYGQASPLLGVVACLHMVVAYLYATNRIPKLAYGREVFTRKREGWKPIERDDAYFADVKKREIERAERERLRKLFEGSLSDDPEDKP